MKKIQKAKIVFSENEVITYKTRKDACLVALSIYQNEANAVGSQHLYNYGLTFTVVDMEEVENLFSKEGDLYKLAKQVSSASSTPNKVLMMHDAGTNSSYQFAAAVRYSVEAKYDWFFEHDGARMLRVESAE